MPNQRQLRNVSYFVTYALALPMISRCEGFSLFAKTFLLKIRAGEEIDHRCILERNWYIRFCRFWGLFWTVQLLSVSHVVNVDKKMTH